MCPVSRSLFSSSSSTSQKRRVKPRWRLPELLTFSVVWASTQPYFYFFPVFLFSLDRWVSIVSVYQIRSQVLNVNKLSWRMPGTAVQTKSVIIFVLQVASKVPSITLSPNLALTPDAKRFWIFLHRSHPKNIFFQDRHLLYLVRSLIFGSLFNWILLHVGQSSISTIHYDLVHGFSSASMFFYNFFCSCLVVFYLGIIFSICQILLASWIDHLGSTVEVHVGKICLSLHRFMFYILKWS